MANKPLHVKITAGIYRGKKLLLPSLESTRSTKSILKGSFFDSFQREIHGVCFIEMFGGSGSMGLEALSRGAKHAYFIEKDTKAYKVLKSNCISIDKDATTPLHGDAFKLLDEVTKKITGPTILYMDPPFSIRDGMDEIYDKTIQTIESLKNENIFLIALEHMSELELPDQIGLFVRKKSKRFGKSSLSFYM
jgi:16S rRNA (guanine(966)-N(2))-methyltransferase RsmD